MHRIHVLLVFGGESSEHDVSVMSARNVCAALDDRKYDLSLCYITRDGHWRYVTDIDSLDINTHSINPVLGGKHFTIEPTGRALMPDVILPILHGPNGEDGSVQGLAQLMHLPIVGNKIFASSVCMNKHATKVLLKTAGINVVDGELYVEGESRPDFGQLTLSLGNPLFVKPVRQGSSVGVSKVYSEIDFNNALTEALKYDNLVLIEQAINGRELECAVLGNTDPQAAGVGEVIPDGEFYSYDSKYDPASKSQVVIPADLPDDITKQICELSVKAYKTLGCEGLARIDFFMDEQQNLYVNEINTMPGFTNISMYPKLWRAAGLNYPDLIDKLIQLAIK